MKVTFENNIPVTICEGCGRKMIGLDAFIFHSVQLNDCEYSLTEDQTMACATNAIKEFCLVCLG